MTQSSSTSLARASLSTMWMQHRFDSLADFAAAAWELGFGGIEVSHIVTPAMIGDADPSRLAIRSVHYPAPVERSPFPKPADALLASPDASARGWAVTQGRGTIDFAERAGATAVCIHLGEVPVPAHLEWALRQRYLGGQAHTAAYVEARTALEQSRRAAAQVALSAARRSLDELAAYAGPRGICLGIESRYHFWEIPTWAELGSLLDQSDPQVVGFWYDCGHVQVLHNLGLHEHATWLAAYAPRIVGVHFHDVVGLRDHLVPGLGELEFAPIATHLPPTAARTCEFDWYFHPAEVVDGARRLAEAGCFG